MEHLIANTSEGGNCEINEIMDIFRFIKEGQTLIVATNSEKFNEYIEIKNDLNYKDEIIDNFININGVIMIFVSLDQKMISKINHQIFNELSKSDITVTLDDLNLLISDETKYFIEIIISKSNSENNNLDDEYVFEEGITGFQNAIKYLVLYKSVIENLKNYYSINSSLLFYLNTEMHGTFSGNGKLKLFQYGDKVNPSGLNREFRISKKLEKELISKYINIEQNRIDLIKVEHNNDTSLINKLFNTELNSFSSFYFEFKELLNKVNYFEIEEDENIQTINTNYIFGK